MAQIVALFGDRPQLATGFLGMDFLGIGFSYLVDCEGEGITRKPSQGS